MNRVIDWNLDGLTIDEDQRHVREIFKGLELKLLWTGRMMTAQEMMKARERVDVDGDRPRLSTSGTHRGW